MDLKPHKVKQAKLKKPAPIYNPSTQTKVDTIKNPNEVVPTPYHIHHNEGPEPLAKKKEKVEVKATLCMHDLRDLSRSIWMIWNMSQLQILHLVMHINAMAAIITTLTITIIHHHITTVGRVH